MKITIPHDLKGKELFDFLRANEKSLIAQKKSTIKHTEPISAAVDFYCQKDGISVKSAGADIPADADVVNVKVVANAAMWCDSQYDVLLPSNAAKSIKERKGYIPHIHDHMHSVEAHLGDVNDIYYQDIALSELGVRKAGQTQCLIFDTDIIKSYNPQIFNLYRKKKINQHSIGLMYMKMGLAINDQEDLARYDLWNKYINDIINKDFVEERGFFWAVSEIKLLENSAVLFGANELTPTLETSTGKSAAGSTDNQPPSFNVSEAIKTTTFFN